MKITRDAKSYAYEEKIDNYWYHYENGKDEGWSGVFIDIHAPEWTEHNAQLDRGDDFEQNDTYNLYTYYNTLKDKRWISDIHNTLVQNHIKYDDKDKSRWKYYFAPKTYEITARNGVTYIITPKRNKDDKDYDQLYCKYVYPHEYDNFGNPDWDSYLPDPAELTKAQDAHTWDEAKLEDILAKCAIDYNRGVFTNNILYANRKGTDEYTPIMRILQQEQIDGNKEIGTYGYEGTAGRLELIHWLKGATNVKYGLLDEDPYAIDDPNRWDPKGYPVGGQPSINPRDDENLVCYDVLNAIGYAMYPNDNEFVDTLCAYPATNGTGGADDWYNHRHIGSNDWNKANAEKGTDDMPKNGYVNPGSDNQKIELYSWLGVVRNNGCDVAQYVYQKQRDDDKVIATFKNSWQRPINLRAPYVDPAIDAKTDENVIYLIKYLKLFDWRGIKDPKYTSADAWGYMWDDHWWFWAYYNVKRIDIDMRPGKIMTNLNKNQRQGGSEWVPLNDVTDTPDINHLILRPIDAETGDWMNMTKVTYTQWGQTAGEEGFVDVVQNTIYVENANTIIKNRMGLEAKQPNGNVLTKSQLRRNMRRFGAIYYRNDTDNVTEFDVRIPITIWYEWGYLDSYVTIHVNSTAGQHNL
jgi:hypothetical protein